MEAHPKLSLLQALIVISVLTVLAIVSFSSGYLTASIRHAEEKVVRAMYLQAVPRSSPF